MGPCPATTVCQLHMRNFKDGDELYLEPWRARAFPVVKDLAVDRSALRPHHRLRRIYLRSTGSAPDGNAIPVPKENSDRAMDAAACIGCGACVAACPNAAAALFTGAKISHLDLLPQGQPEAVPARAGHGRADERTSVRQLHQHRRMRSGLPEVHPA